jgi:hypothetical protein
MLRAGEVVKSAPNGRVARPRSDVFESIYSVPDFRCVVTIANRPRRGNAAAEGVDTMILFVTLEASGGAPAPTGREGEET